MIKLTINNMKQQYDLIKLFNKYNIDIIYIYI